MYGSEQAAIYDIIHSRRRAYRDEARQITTLVRHRLPDADSLLDVACGTGGHLAHFRDWFSQVSGMDVSRDMLDVARRKLGDDVVLDHGDMRSMSGRGGFDVVTCLYFAIGYCSSEAELDHVVARLAANVRQGGVVVVEPWLSPDALHHGRGSHDWIEHEERRIARFGHFTRVGNQARLETHYLVADPGGVVHFSEVHTTSLFTPAQYQTAFERAGCAVELVRDSAFSHGLYVGVRTAGSC